MQFWTVQHALARLGALLPAAPDTSPLAARLPDRATLADARLPPSDEQPHQQCGAIASNLLAGLEMAKQDHLRLEQVDAALEVRFHTRDATGILIGSSSRREYDSKLARSSV